MILEKELTIDEVLDEMNRLKKRIEVLNTILRIKLEPLKGLTYKDVISKTSNIHNDIMLNRIEKKDKLLDELVAKVMSYNDYRWLAIEKIQKMREEKSVEEMIVFYRDKLHWSWKHICKLTNYSRSQANKKYNKAKNIKR